MEIQILAPEVIDQIAAGEVVERPAHLVKELIENSLDARATQIEVDVDQGGRKIKVCDNGAGIAKDDLPLVCARHATSKILAANDLWSLKTFGFRGEALASISSVSRLKIVSRKRDHVDAYALENNYGISVGPLPTGAGPGTQIEVDELFHNVPARLKFLKSDSAEVSQIKAVVRAMALANPQVEFKFKHQGKVVFFYPARESLLERAKAVLESKDLYAIERTHQGHHLEAVIGSPNTTTGNSKQIWIFVQDRWVQDRTIQAAVLEAYRNTLMHGEYPFAVLKIQAPPDSVDVNIHPTKSQIKFADQSLIFRLVHSAIRAELEQAPWLGTLNRPEERSPAASAPLAAFSQPQSLSFRDSSFERTQYSQKSYEPTPLESAMTSPAASVFSGASSVSPSSIQATNVSTSDGGDDREPQAPAKFWSGLHVIGQSNLTYILAEGQNALFLIDQHASHERVVFERLMEGWKNGQFEVQDFLLPISIDLAAEQVEAMLALKDEFSRMGLQFEQGGPETLLISSSPTIVSERALVASLKKFAEETTQVGGSFSFEKKIGDVFATMACHSVVRAGQALSVAEMKALLAQMDEFSLSSYCPHGRNVYVEIPFYKIEKDFGRIP